MRISGNPLASGNRRHCLEDNWIDLLTDEANCPIGEQHDCSLPRQPAELTTFADIGLAAWIEAPDRRRAGCPPRPILTSRFNDGHRRGHPILDLVGPGPFPISEE